MNFEVVTRVGLIAYLDADWAGTVILELGSVPWGKCV